MDIMDNDIFHIPAFQIDLCRFSIYGYDQRLEVMGPKGMLHVKNETPNKTGESKPPISVKQPGPSLQFSRVKMAVQRCQCTIPSPQGDPPSLISTMISANQTQRWVCEGAGSLLGRGAGQGVHVSDGQDDGSCLKDRRRMRRLRKVGSACRTGLDCG